MLSNINPKRNAAEMFPLFKFIAIKRQTKKQGGGWTMEEF